LPEGARGSGFPSGFRVSFRFRAFKWCRGRRRLVRGIEGPGVGGARDLRHSILEFVRLPDAVTRGRAAAAHGFERICRCEAMIGSSQTEISASAAP
jgi:hypothetical protein